MQQLVHIKSNKTVPNKKKSIAKIICAEAVCLIYTKVNVYVYKKKNWVTRDTKPIKGTERKLMTMCTKKTANRKG